MVKNVNIINNIKEFLYDKNYFISLFDNNVHLFNYEKITKLSKKFMSFSFTNFNIIIDGNELIVDKLLNKEIVISGNIKNIGISYE